MTRAKDQPASPHGRPATLYELESGGKILAREWVDESKDLMISRENLYPQGTERYELIAFEAEVPEAAVFDPASY